jgi:hypothetical protein
LCSTAGEHCENGDTSAATFRNCLEDGLQDPLFGSTERGEIKDSRQLTVWSAMSSLEELTPLSAPLPPLIGLVDQPAVQDLLLAPNICSSLLSWLGFIPGLPRKGKSEDGGAFGVVVKLFSGSISKASPLTRG